FVTEVAVRAGRKGAGANGSRDQSPLFSSRYCEQGQAGARAVKRLWITPAGTPGVSLATASARASMMAFTSARTASILSSRLSGRVVFMDFASFDGFRGGIRIFPELLPDGRGLILGASQRFLAAHLVARDEGLPIIRQRPEMLLAIVG